MHVPLSVIVWCTRVCLYVYVQTVVFCLFTCFFFNFLFFVLVTRSYCIDLAVASCCVDLAAFLFSSNHLQSPEYSKAILALTSAYYVIVNICTSV